MKWWLAWGFMLLAVAVLLWRIGLDECEIAALRREAARPACTCPCCLGGDGR